MLKPYKRNKLMTDKIIDKCNVVYSNIQYTKFLLYNILKDKDTLYSIEEIQVHNNDTYLLEEITGVDNVCIVMYYGESNTTISSVVILDREHGYTIDRENSLYGHLVGLYSYRLFDRDRGYIIKTNYKSVDELKMKFGIEVNNYISDNYISDIEIVLPYVPVSTDDI